MIHAPLNDVREVGSLVHRAAAAYGPRTALVYKSQRWTFGDLSRSVAALARRIACQTQPGDRVAIVASNSDRAAIAILATMAARAIAVPLQSDVSPSRLRCVLSDCAVRLTFADAVDAVTACEWAGPVLPLERVSPPPAPGPIEDDPPDPDDMAVIFYTSGSTQSPRGVVCSHRQVAFCVDVTNGALAHTRDDVILSARPLSFVYGFHQLFVALASGATLILSNALPLGPDLPRLLVQERVTGLPLVPSAVAALLRSRALEGVAIPSLRYAASTGDCLAPAHIAALRRAAPGLSVVSMYGLTECGRAAILPPQWLEGHESSVGLPVPGTSVRLVKAGGAVPGPHEEGELRVRGPHVASGYWRNDALTRERFLVDPVTGERELCTGDLFTRDAEGFLYFVSRAETLIKSRGECICAPEVEAVLTMFPGIAEAAAVGSSIDSSGEVVVAFVVDDGSAIDMRDLRRHCAKHLTVNARPVRFIRSAELLPRNQNGKIDRQLLRRLATDAAETGRLEGVSPCR